MSKVDPKKIEGLSREEKIKLIQAVEEKRRRRKERGLAYKPHSEQAEVHKCPKYIRVVTSGNGWGKSAFTANEVLAAADGYNPWQDRYTKVPARIMLVLDNPSKVEDQFLPELRKWTDISKLEMRKNGKPYVNQIIFPNGSNLLIGFHLQEQLFFEGIEVDYIFADEPPPRHVIIGLLRGQRTKGAEPRVLIVGTMIGSHWIRAEWYNDWLNGERPDIEFFRGSTDANRQNLAEGYIERFSKNLTEAEKRVRLEGEFGDVEGLALAHLFNKKRHVYDEGLAKQVRKAAEEEGWACVVAIDPHPNKKHTAVLVAADRYGYMHVLDELSLKALAKDFARTLLERWGKYRVRDWVCDSLGSADLTGGDGFKSFIQVLNDCGVRARSTTYREKQDDAFIERIRSTLELPDDIAIPPKIRIHPECYGLIKDIDNVAWVKQRNQDEYKNKLEISNRDFLSCLKYALAAGVPTAKNRGKIIRTRAKGPNFGARRKIKL